MIGLGGPGRWVITTQCPGCDSIGEYTQCVFERLPQDCPPPRQNDSSLFVRSLKRTHFFDTRCAADALADLNVVASLLSI